MEKIDSFRNSINEKFVSDYRFGKRISVADIPKVMEVLVDSGIEILRLRLSNCQEGPDHFFRVFSNVAEFNSCVWDDQYIDDFGVTGLYHEIKFDITFDYISNKVVTVAKVDIDLEPLLIKIEEHCQTRDDKSL